MKKLTRDEMKSVKGGSGQLYNWNCQDVPGGPFISNACSATNPIGPNCPEYYCYNTGVPCTTKTITCS
jgi:hypothetical protein